jgi:hypothetical protein
VLPTTTSQKAVIEILKAALDNKATQIGAPGQARLTVISSHRCRRICCLTLKFSNKYAAFSPNLIMQELQKMALARDSVQEKQNLSYHTIQQADE